jgi:sugar (pentulose or hexulose) kinase
MVKPKRRYIPIEKNVAKYEEHFEEYQEIYKNIKTIK